MLIDLPRQNEASARLHDKMDVKKSTPFGGGNSCHWAFLPIQSSDLQLAELMQEVVRVF